MLLFIVALSVISAVALILGAIDAVDTEEGIAKGIAVEGNPLITFWAGDKPKPWQITLYNLVTISIPFIVGLFYGHIPVVGGLALGAQSANLLDHIKGIKEWNWMFKNPDKKLPNATISQKLGFWIFFQ